MWISIFKCGFLYTAFVVERASLRALYKDPEVPTVGLPKVAIIVTSMIQKIGPYREEDFNFTNLLLKKGFEVYFVGKASVLVFVSQCTRRTHRKPSQFVWRPRSSYCGTPEGRDCCHVDDPEDRVLPWGRLQFHGSPLEEGIRVVGKGSSINYFTRSIFWTGDSGHGPA